MIKSRAGRLARNLIGGAALRLPAVGHKAAGTVSGIGIDYPQAPRAHDVELQDNRRLYEVLRDGRFVLLAPDAADPGLATRVRADLQAARASFTGAREKRARPDVQQLARAG